MSDTIFIKEKNRFMVPREPASDPEYIKHVNCEGAYFHVISYSTSGMRCSEPKCILNKQLDNGKD